MKTIKTRLISTLLVILTLLGLLPTSAFAATGTGKGITITKDQAYWSTRLLANGTPYSYRPPMAAGRLLYCLDSGLGYHNATQSFFDSYTYTSATNADADTVLKTGIANSGLGEMDVATLANVKWLMTYINDSNASNVGQLFMAVQTYVWDHQSYKGEPGGDGDAGGYRTLPLVPQYRELLLRMREHQDACRELCGNCYFESDYIYVNDLGQPFKPNYVTQHFKLFLRNNGLREITFHELRHTCASLLLKSGVSMKDIQEWLGHSSYSTTANIYAHLDSTAKKITGDAMQGNVDISANVAAKSRARTQKREEFRRELG